MMHPHHMASNLFFFFFFDNFPKLLTVYSMQNSLHYTPLAARARKPLQSLPKS